MLWPQPNGQLTMGTLDIQLQNLTRDLSGVPDDLVDHINLSLDRFQYIPSSEGIDTITVSIMSWDYPLDPTIEDEQYSLVVSSSGITISSKSVIGSINAITTLMQLVECDSDKCKIPNTPITISDQPKYSYRGILLDVSRNYMPV